MAVCLPASLGGQQLLTPCPTALHVLQPASATCGRWAPLSTISSCASCRHCKQPGSSRRSSRSSSRRSRAAGSWPTALPTFCWQQEGWRLSPRAAAWRLEGARMRQGVTALPARMGVRREGKSGLRAMRRMTISAGGCREGAAVAAMKGGAAVDCQPCRNGGGCLPPHSAAHLQTYDSPAAHC